jgi:hypothetical protein
LEATVAEIEDVDPPLPGVEKIEALITARGDDPALDNTVRHLVEGSVLYVLGQPTLEWVDVVHYEVRFGFEPISLVPVFTRYRFADEAILMNMSWLYLEASAVEARHVLADMQPHEWLAINPWSDGNEFYLPPRPWQRGRAGDGRVDPCRQPHGRVIRRRAALRRARRVPGRRGRSAPESS